MRARDRKADPENGARLSGSMPESAGELRPRELIRPGTAVKRGLNDATPTGLQVRGRKLQRRAPKLVGRTLEQRIRKQPKEVDSSLSQVSDGVVQIDVRAKTRHSRSSRPHPDIAEKQERDCRSGGRQTRALRPGCRSLRKRRTGLGASHGSSFGRYGADLLQTKSASLATGAKGARLSMGPAHVTLQER